MPGYAHTLLMNMLTDAVAGSDLAEVLEPMAGQERGADALLEGLRPVVGMLLQVGMGLGGRVAAETAGLGEVEEELRSGGRELIRALMQAVMDAAWVAEERHRGGVDGPDEQRRTRVEDRHARTVATVFGRITRRKAYRAPGAGNVYPLDEVLDLPAGLYSPGPAPVVHPGSGAWLVHRRRRRDRVPARWGLDTAQAILALRAIKKPPATSKTTGPTTGSRNAHPAFAQHTPICAAATRGASLGIRLRGSRDQFVANAPGQIEVAEPATCMALTVFG
jgi:hypothetical protein